MNDSNNLFRRAGVALLILGAMASAVGFTFILDPRTSGTPLPIKWPPGSIAIKIMLGNSSTPLTDGEASFNTTARTAAQAWNAVIGSAQIQTTFGTGTAERNNGINDVAFASTVYGTPFDPGVLAVTLGNRVGNGRTEADILFNAARTWNSYRGPRQGNMGTDLQRVAMHEMGHLLGLDHPDQAGQNVNAIMNSTVGDLDTLTSDDIEGARSLYGPPGVPENNNFSLTNPILPLAVPGTTTVNGFNTNATKETGEPKHADLTGGRSVWWRWTAPSDGNATIDTRGSYFDTALGVYTGTSVSALTTVASDDDIEDGVTQSSTVTFPVTAGTIYRIAVDGYNGIDQDSSDRDGADSGGITLNLKFTSTSTGTAPAITTQPASLTVNAGSSASFSVVATGTPAPTYQWLLNNTAISGATSATYSIASTTTAQAGTYSVTVTNTVGSVTSNGATLTVSTPAPTPTPTPGGGGGGGGGGAPSSWFCLALAGLGLGRWLRRNRQ